MTKNSNIDSGSGWTKVLPSLLIPLCVGMSGYLGIMVLIEQGFISNDQLLRYLTGHPISKITLAMFCIGIAALMRIGDNVFHQFRHSTTMRLSAAGLRFKKESNSVASEGADSQPGLSQADDSLDAELPSPRDRATAFITELRKYRRSYHEHYLWRRLESAMQCVCRTGSAAGLEDELKYQADVDADRQQQRYSLVRILIWATPMLGFLGTVLGISQALGSIEVGPNNDFQQMMGGLRSHLNVAFDTTALALTLSIVLMFVLFLIERFETQLLRQVDERATRDVAMNFASDIEINPQAYELERIGRTVLATTRQVVLKQSEIWQSTIQSAEQAWLDSVTNANLTVGNNLKEAVSEAVDALGGAMDSSIDRADESMAKRWEQWQVSLSYNARMMVSNQQELARQTDLLESILKQVHGSNANPNKSNASDTKEVSSRPRQVADPSPQVFFSAKALASDGQQKSDSGQLPTESTASASLPRNLKIFQEGVSASSLAAKSDLRKKTGPESQTKSQLKRSA